MWNVSESFSCKCSRYEEELELLWNLIIKYFVIYFGFVNWACDFSSFSSIDEELTVLCNITFKHPDAQVNHAYTNTTHSSV
jgi:hypothetical protein